MQIKSTKDIKAERINALIYGQSGAGKTTLAGTLKGKTIIISLESGLLSLRSKDVDYIEIKGEGGVSKIAKIKEALNFVSKSDYVNVYIDSLTEIAQCFVEYAKHEYPEDRQTMKMWGRYSELITAFIKYCRDMDKNVFFTALEKTTQDDVGRRFCLPELPGSIATKCPAYFDLVFNLRVIKTDEKELRVLLTSSKENYICKDRSGKLQEYVKPDLGAIMHEVFE